MNNVKKHDRRAIYAWIVDYKISHDGISPTIREIMRGTGVKSSSNMMNIITELEREGLIHAPRGRSRSIALVGGEGGQLEQVQRLRALLSKVYSESLMSDGGRRVLSKETLEEITRALDTVTQRV